MVRAILWFICSVLGISLFACGGGSSTTLDNVTVGVSPLSATVGLSGTQQFTATTYGSSNTSVTWQVNGVTGGNSTYGTISGSGLYSAPQAFPNPSTITITAVSQANTADIANSSVTLVSGVTVTISPAAVNLQLGQTEQFAANVTGSSTSAVSWQAGGVNGGNSTVGTISSSGLYTAPSSANTPLSVSVTAVSQLDATKAASASVTIHDGMTVVVSPNPVSVRTFGTQQFTAAVTGNSNTAVTWQVNGVLGGSSVTGTISAAGSYSAPNSVPTQASKGVSKTAAVTVSAVSQADATVIGSAIVTVFAANQSQQNFPVPLGVSGGNGNDSNGTTCCGGTLGALVSRGGNQYILGNSHVLARTDLGSTGDPIVQPGLPDASCAATETTAVATLSQFVDLQPSSGQPLADAALAQIIPGKVDTSGTILALGGTSNNRQPTDAPPHAGSGVAASLNQAVAKSGRSTGLTCSTIGAIEITSSIPYQEGCGSGASFQATFTDLVEVLGGSFSADGDSGALIVTQDTADPVAMIVASTDGGTLAAPVSDVLAALADPNTAERPVFVGTAGNHPVAACSLAAPQSNSISASIASLSSAAITTARTAKQKYADELMAKAGVQGVGITVNEENPQEAALVVYVVKDVPHDVVPSSFGGVRIFVRESTRFSVSSSRQSGQHSCGIFPGFRKSAAVRH